MSIRNRNYFRLSLTTLTFGLLLTLSMASAAWAIPAALETTKAPVEDFQIVGAGQGWVQISGQIFWTNNNGANWTEITPQLNGQVISLTFLNSQTGFLVSQELTLQQEMRYWLYTTLDQGSAWSREEIVTLPIRDPLAIAAKVSAFFLDGQTGWIVFKQATSSNFNIGAIYHTIDGGQTWQTSPAPLGEPVTFRNPQLGFSAGGVHAQNIFQTLDGGSTWTQTPLSTELVTAIGQPNFLTAQAAYLPALVSTESGTELHIYGSNDSGTTWKSIDSTQISTQPDLIGLFDNLPGEIKALAGDTLYSYYLTSHQLTEISPLSLQNITSIGFVSHDTGWALSNQSACAEDSQPCTSIATLYATSDGGNTWQPLDTPQILISLPAVSIAEPDQAGVPLLSRTSVLQGQGFDQCWIASPSNLQAWKNNSPLSAINLYFGGKSRACKHPFFNDYDTGKDFIETLSIQGWKFIPTWVGPQAPEGCTLDYSFQFSLDPSTAYDQGRDEGTEALRYARKFGLAEDDESGTVIYYDLEAFNVENDACLKAAKKFISGWVDRLQESNVTAGVYGSVCASGLDRFYTLDNPPDVIWPAYWYYSTPTYTSYVTPYGLPCISDSMWGDQQRIFQYTGAHNETWGNVTMSVDLNSIDGIVADISRQVGVPTTTLQNYSFETGTIAPWEIQNTPADCNWSVVNDPDIAHSNDHYLAINRTLGDTNCSGVQQTLTHTLPFNSRYRFAVWARSATSTNPRQLTLKITGEGITPLVTTKYFGNITDKWVCLESNFFVSSYNLTGITTEIELMNNDSVDLYLDNAHLSLNTGLLCPTIPSPTGMYASPEGDRNRALVNWDDVPPATYYQIYRSISPSTTKSFIGYSATNQFIDTNASYWDEYNYWVKACTSGATCSQFSQLATGNAISPYLDFYDGFETGDTSRWTSVSQPDQIQACTEGDLVGKHGLCVDAGSTTGGLLGLNLINGVDHTFIKFKLDPNSFNPGSDLNVFTILKLVDTGETKIAFQLRIIKSNNTYYLIAIGLDNAGVNHSTSWIPISNSPNTIAVNWQSSKVDARAAWAGAAGFSIRVNGVLKAEVTGLDNTNYIVDQILFGGQNIGSSTSSTGTFYLDEFTFQGPLYIRQ